MSLQNSTPYVQIPTDAPTRARIFLVHEWRISEETHLFIWRLLNEIFNEGVYKQKWCWKGLLIALLEESQEGYLQVSLHADSTLTCCHEQKPQEPWRSRWPWERNVERSALTHARHTHCASRQLGTTADRRYDVPWDWLQEAWQMTRVCWGTRCKGFCSKEGLHCQMEWSARN